MSNKKLFWHHTSVNVALGKAVISPDGNIIGKNYGQDLLGKGDIALTFRFDRNYVADLPPAQRASAITAAKALGNQLLLDLGDEPASADFVPGMIVSAKDEHGNVLRTGILERETELGFVIRYFSPRGKLILGHMSKSMCWFEEEDHPIYGTGVSALAACMILREEVRDYEGASALLPHITDEEARKWVLIRLIFEAAGSKEQKLSLVAKASPAEAKEILISLPQQWRDNSFYDDTKADKIEALAKRIQDDACLLEVVRNATWGATKSYAVPYIRDCEILTQLAREGNVLAVHTLEKLGARENLVHLAIVAEGEMLRLALEGIRNCSSGEDGLLTVATMTSNINTVGLVLRELGLEPEQVRDYFEGKEMPPKLLQNIMALGIDGDPRWAIPFLMDRPIEDLLFPEAGEGEESPRYQLIRKLLTLVNYSGAETLARIAQLARTDECRSWAEEAKKECPWAT